MKFYRTDVTLPAIVADHCNAAAQLNCRFEFQVTPQPGAQPLSVALVWNEQGLLRRIDFAELVGADAQSAAAASSGFVPASAIELVAQLKDYFQSGTPMPVVSRELLDQEEWTDFQKKVYRTICEIPHGETRTYGWVAYRLGKWAATRAVGQALKKNPIPIVIPCHRVVSSTSLGGFMGRSDPGDPELLLKSRLISLEERYRQPLFPFLCGGGSAGVLAG